jgi:hypothetical protein
VEDSITSTGGRRPETRLRKETNPLLCHSARSMCPALLMSGLAAALEPRSDHENPHIPPRFEPILRPDPADLSFR